MNHLTPAISVIIPCFNEEDDLFKSVNSVLQQSVRPSEIIIIDDASTNEKTRKVLREVEKMDLVKVIYLKENKGPGIARNKGIEASTSNWILLLDSDDILLEGAIENVLKSVEDNPSADFFFWNYSLNEMALKKISTISTNEVCEDGTPVLDPYKLARNFIIPGCSPYKKQMWEAVGGYDPQLSKGGVEDIDFWRRSILNGAKGIHIDKTLYQWNRKATGNNSNIDEAKYLLHRQKILPYYDKYNPEQAKEIRPYIYRYYSSRLMAKELNDFLIKEKIHFSILHRLKAKGLYIKPLYKVVRLIKNKLMRL